MKTTAKSISERVYSFLDKFEEIFITLSGIVIGLSPFLALLQS